LYRAYIILYCRGVCRLCALAGPLSVFGDDSLPSYPPIPIVLINGVCVCDLSWKKPQRRLVKMSRKKKNYYSYSTTIYNNSIRCDENRHRPRTTRIRIPIIRTSSCGVGIYEESIKKLFSPSTMWVRIVFDAARLSMVTVIIIHDRGCGTLFIFYVTILGPG